MGFFLCGQLRAANHVQIAGNYIVCLWAVTPIRFYLILSAEETNVEIVAKLTAYKKSLVVMERTR